MGGSSKGGGGHTPHEAPDSLRSAQKLRAIGLISLGPIKGPANKWKDTYFDNTPIQNANGVDVKIRVFPFVRWPFNWSERN